MVGGLTGPKVIARAGRKGAIIVGLLVQAAATIPLIYKTPAKESDPRLLGPIFYNDQEDLVAARVSMTASRSPCCGRMWRSGSASDRR